MAKIPGTNQFGHQTPNVQRGGVNTSGVTQGLESIENLGRVGADIASQIEKNRLNVETARNVTEAINRIDEREFQLLNEDRDYTTQVDRYQSFYRDMESEYQKKYRGRIEHFNQWKGEVERYAFRKGLNIKSAAMTSEMGRQKSVLGTTLSEVSGIAIRGDEDQYNEAVTKAISLIDDAKENGILDDTERATLQQKFRNELSRGKVQQDINNDPALALSRVREGHYAGLNAQEQSMFEARAMSALSQRKNLADHELTKQSTETLSDTLIALKNGYDVTNDEIANGRNAAKVLGKEEDFEVALAASHYILLPKSERDGLPDSLQGVDNAEMRSALESANATIERELEKDGYAFAVAQGVIEHTPIDPANPQSIAARLSNVEYLRQHYGREISPLTDAEADMFTQILPTLSPGQKTQWALAFGSSNAIWEQIDKKNAETFAMVGAIGDKAVMDAVFKGQQRLSDKLASSVTPGQYLSVFDEHVADVYTGKDRKAMLEASLAHYAGTSDSSDFKPDDFKESIEAVSGGIGKINGHKIELPRGVSEDDFEDYIDDFSVNAVEAFGGVWGMTSEQAAEVIRESKIESIGNNRYIAVQPPPSRWFGSSDERGAVLMAADGKQPFVFNFDPGLHAEDQARKRVDRRGRPL